MSEPDSPTFFVPKVSVNELQAPCRLVVDCRPQTCYDQGHFRNAISLAFPAIMWRRVLKQRARPGCLDEFLMCDNSELKKRHEKGMSVVLYDESTCDITDASSTSPLRVLCEMLLLEKRASIYFLEGGFKALSALRPDLVATTSVSCFPSLSLSWANPPSPCANANLFQSTFIWDFIIIGSEQDAHNVAFLDRSNITHVLNLTPTDFKPEVARSRKCKQIRLIDSSAQDILSIIPAAIEFIQSASQSGGRILVHCLAGISRSSAIVIAYIMWKGHLSVPEAYDVVRAHRTCASPNINFMGQLMVFGKCLCCNSQKTSTPAQAALLASVILRKSVHRPICTPTTPITTRPAAPYVH